MALGCVLNVLASIRFPQMPVRVCSLSRVNLYDPCAFTCFVRIEQEVMLRCGADNVLMTEDYDVGLDANRGLGRRVRELV